MTATALVSWPDLVHESTMSGRLPIVIPTGSYPLVGYFDPLPKYELDFALALLHVDARVRCTAITAALISAHRTEGIE